jgi:choline monooxygenase
MCYRFDETLHRYQNIVIDKMVGIDCIPPGDEEEAVRMFRSNGSVEGT